MVGAYAVPMGFLFGVLAAAGRMSADAEVTAMRACGMGLGALLGPVLLVAVAVSVLTALLMMEYEPMARREPRGRLARGHPRAGRVQEHRRPRHLRAVAGDGQPARGHPDLGPYQPG